MKLSYYTIAVDVPAGKVLYNTMYKNIAELTADECGWFENLTHNAFRPTNQAETSLLESLANQLFVVEDGMNELACFQLEWNRSLYSSGIVRHTILPNLSCNLDCPYCFENKTGKFMSREIELLYLAWLEKQLPDAKYFYLTWYGGEPLLSKGTIRRLTKHILHLKEQFGFEYAASVVTNGTLLDERFTEQAAELGIKSVQVTLDGDQAIHDTYRFVKGSHAGTFNTILVNMAKFCETNSSDVASILRVNVTDANYETIPALLDKVPTIVKSKCVVLFRWVYSHADGRNPGQEFSSKLKGNSPFTNLAPLYALAESLGFCANSFDEGRTYNFCECDFDNAFLIDQDGDLFMCTHNMSKQESVGNVRDGFLSQGNISRYARFVTANPFDDQECLQCNILPICKGGCRKARFVGKKTCSDVKFDISGYVLQKYQKALSASSH
ncbi:MAG TPA: SPASM domain-containing protein [Candidatus Saccharimonadales bacterium]|jgi:uncharacterized protein|nr:SPASM domain-containing protein [Candidatus Saccharimonadales bacterium]